MKPQTQIVKMADKVANECLGRKLRSVGRVLTSIYDKEMSAFGLTINQFAVMTIILKVGTPTQSQIAELHNIEKSTLSRNLKLMRDAGWVILEKNGRNVDVHITKSGRELYLRSFPAWERGQEAMKKVLSSEGLLAVEVLSGQMTKM